jgi:hypothetical protein
MVRVLHGRIGTVPIYISSLLESLTVPRKQVLPLPIFSIILLHASHGLPTATARKYILHYKDFNSIALLFSISILFLEPYAAACLVLRLSSSRVPYKAYRDLEKKIPLFDRNFKLIAYRDDGDDK